MSEGVTFTQIASAVLFLIAVSGTMWGIWWRIEGKVSDAKKDAMRMADVAVAKADLVSSQLAEQKLHVAETYVSKQGHRESNEQVMEAISSVKAAIDGTNQRIDRLFESPRQTRGRT